MLIYFSVISILIIINQFLIYTKLQDLEDRMKIYEENEVRLYKLFRDAINCILVQGDERWK